MRRRDMVHAVAQRLRPLVDRETRLGYLLHSARARLPARTPPLVIARVLETFARSYPRACVVQIGSNDGVKHDPLRRHLLARRWRAVLVEPVPYVYARLERNFRHIRRIQTIQAAIGDNDATAVLHHLREADEQQLPDWYDGIGSLDRDVILSHVDRIPDIAQRMVSIEVPSLRFETLCREYAPANPDLVHIDTEGHDFEVLRQMDLTTTPTRLLLYEHYHLGADEPAARAHVQSHGFETIQEGLDTLCLRMSGLTRRDRDLVAAFKQLQAVDRPVLVR